MHIKLICINFAPYGRQVRLHLSNNKEKFHFPLLLLSVCTNFAAKK